ncbi:MAG: VacJ family lipoprotein [Desulfobulbaceae bacterium]|nr:VacJ family lipoprotein [Desulfobulbaceae bacterium]
MKTVRVVILALVLLFALPFPVFANTSIGSNSYPDLLNDDFEESFDDEFYDEYEEFIINDPIEPVNRFFFGFNDVVYEWLLKPVTDGYIWIVPRDLRESFGNFFFNLSAPVRFVNSLLQGQFQQSGVVMERFLINSTLGVYGLVDIASIEFDIEPKRADFGQTLGRWGLGSGIYICWPLVGPSSIRDSVGLAVDAYSHPIPYFHDSRVLDVLYYTSNRVNTLSLNPTVYDDLKRYSLDPYIASRQAYYEYREAIIKKQ